MIRKGGERLQKMLSKHVIEKDCFESIQTCAGVDVSYTGDTASAACVLMAYGSVIDQNVFKGRPTFPYVSTFFALREFPLIYEVVNGLKSQFDIMFVHGHGRAHPRKFGLACHAGLYFQKPTIGIAGNILVGDYDKDFTDWTYLYRKHEVIGAVVQTHPKMNPIFVSVGHMISLKTAIKITVEQVKTHKFPEALRLAHVLSRKNRN